MGGKKFSAFVLLSTIAGIAPVDAPALAPDGCDTAVAHAIALLPRRPADVRVVDRDRMPAERRARLQRVQGYMAEGDSTVYLVKQGEVLQHAIRYGGVYDYALATIIWHEMAHIEGGAESGARREEERLWRWFVLGRQVDQASGMAYLARLAQRR